MTQRKEYQKTRKAKNANKSSWEVYIGKQCFLTYLEAYFENGIKKWNTYQFTTSVGKSSFGYQSMVDHKINWKEIKYFSFSLTEKIIEKK